MTFGEEPPAVSEEDWAKTPASVQHLVLSLLKRIATLEAEVASLKERLGLNSSNSSKPPSSDPPGTPPSAPPKGSPRKRGGQKGHPGHRRERLPPTRVESCVPTTCAGCQAPLTGQDPEPAWHQVVELPAVVREVIEYQVHTLTCACCGQDTTGALPEGVSRKGFGPRLQAWVALLTGRYRLSKRLVEEMLGEVFEIPMSLGAVVDCEQEVSAALAPAWQEAHAVAQAQPVANVDETSWRENKRRAWLWVMVTRLATVFLIHPRRSRLAARILLGDFDGVVGSDRYSAYDDLNALLRQLCWAHLTRDWQRMVDRGGASRTVGEDLQHLTRKLFRWWNHVATGRRSRGWMQRKLPELQREFRAILQGALQIPHARTAATCASLLEQFESLWTFVRVEGVEPTNNAAERAVRPAVQARKLSFGTDSAAGSRFVERILTVVATLRQHGRSLLPFLTDTLRAFRAAAAPPSLLPQTTIQIATP